jgi:NAD(P)H-flavin reductase
MLAKKFRAEIVELVNTIEGIYTVSFQSLGRPFKFLPGQFLHLSIDCEYDGIGQWPESRCFSIQSNPDDSIIKITYSVKGRYTRLMEDVLRTGAIVWLKLPYGDLFQQMHEKSNTVFIAGGTGITPYLSLFSHKSFDEYTNPKIYLGFRSKKHNIYESELAKLSQGTFHVKIFYEDIEGLLDINSIYKENGAGSNYFISGPPKMVGVFKEQFANYGIQANNILTDDWE